MNSQFDPSAFSPAQYGVAQPPVEQTPLPDLRTLSTGEVLDRTFALYRRRIWLFSGIALGPALMLTLSSLVRLFYQHYFPVHVVPGNPLQTSLTSLAYVGKTTLIFLPVSAAVLVIFALGQAATSRAIADLYGNLQPTIVGSYRAVLRGWLRWSGVYLWQLWSLGWLPLLLVALLFGSVAGAVSPGSKLSLLWGSLAALSGLGLFGGLIYGTLAYLKNSLALPVAVLEERPVRQSIRRSRMLTTGRRGRIFLLYLLLWALQMVVGGLQLPLAYAVVRAHAAGLILVQAGLLLVQLISSTFIGPIAAIGLTLFYIDERVRREGFEFEFQMTRSFLPLGADSIAATPAVPPAAVVASE